MSDSTVTSKDQSPGIAQGTPKAESKESNVPELSNSEKKKLQKAEKQARRAKEKAEAQQPNEVKADGRSSPKLRRDSTNRSGDREPEISKHEKAGKPGQQESTKLPVRQRRQSQGGPREPPTSTAHRSGSPAARPQKPKQVSCFAHLYGQQPRRNTLDETSKDVHPTVQRLALKINNYAICGSHARCVAMLQAFKTVIRDYSTPLGRSLPRDLPTHTLSPQISHLKTHGRQLSSSQSSAIRWLKNAIATLDPSMPDQAAKSHLCKLIDEFVRERLTVADKIIAETAAGLINDGKQQEGADFIGEEETVLVYGCSAVVRKAIATAVLKEKKRFRVIVVDSRPRHEGRAMAKSLAALITSKPIHSLNSTFKARRPSATKDPAPVPERQGGITQLDLLPLGSALATAAQEATLVLLGAHSILANGSVYARAGTAGVALLCKEMGNASTSYRADEGRRSDSRTAPTTITPSQSTGGSFSARPRVIVLAETLKFTERVALDSIVMNELAPGEELQLHEDQRDDDDSVRKDGNDKLLYLNPMHDVTPAELIDAVITELGFIGPGAGGVEGILRLKEREEEAGVGVPEK